MISTYYFTGSTNDINVTYKDKIVTQAETDIDIVKTVFTELKDDNYYLNLSISLLITKISRLISGLNVIHPFKYVNTFTRKIFLILLAKNAGYNIKLYTSLPKQWQLANQEAFISLKKYNYDDTYLQSLINYALIKL